MSNIKVGDRVAKLVPDGPEGRGHRAFEGKYIGNFANEVWTSTVLEINDGMATLAIGSAEPVPVSSIEKYTPFEERKYSSKYGSRMTDCCGAKSDWDNGNLCCVECGEVVSEGQGDGTEHKRNYAL